MKKNLLKIAFAVLCLFGALQASAETIDWLYVDVADGDSYRLAIYDTPKVTFEGKEVIVTAGEERIAIDAYKLVNFTFGNSGGVEDLQAEGGLTFFWDHGTLRIFGMQPGEGVALCDVAGRMLFQGKADNSGYAEINIEGRTGVMIVTTASKTIKFTK